MESPLPRYTIPFDEDGFPLFNGLRVDDESLLKDLIEHLGRYNPQDLRSSVVTSCEGELCFVDSFSTPLVAQSVEEVNEKSAVWKFLGGRREVIYHENLLQDDWARVHTWVGPSKLCASLRSKAQSSLLQSLPATTLAKLQLPPLWQTKEAVGGKEFWNQCYQDKSDGWDMGSVTPVLARHFTEVKEKFFPGSALLVPGCGRGHDAAFLADQGLSVEAVDFSEEAEREAKRLYSNKRNLHFSRADIFQCIQQKPGAFDGIFEHTIFCAIDPSQRQTFVQSIARALKPGGYWFGVFFLRSSPGGPPFGLTQWELRERVKDDFEIFDWKISPASATPRKNQELWAVFRRRPL